MAASKFELTTAGIASTARSEADKLGGLSVNANTQARPISSALLDLAVAVERLEDAKAKAATILSDSRFLAQYKSDQAHAVVDPAYAKASAAVAAVSAALDTARAAARKAVLGGGNVPAKDSPMAAFQADQIVKALEKTPDGGLARVNLLAKYLRDAQTRGDTITVDVILNRLDVVYDRLGINTGLIFSQLAQVVQASPVPDTSGNAELLAMLSRGGSGTISGLVDTARYVLKSDQESYNKWLAGMLRDGQLNGVMDHGGTAKPAAGVVPGGIGGPVPPFTRSPRGGTFS